MKKTATVTLETVRQLMSAFPGVEEGTSWGMPTFRVRGKMLARLQEDGESLVLKCADRDLLLQSEPQTFYVTKHYLNHPLVLIRLAKVRQAALRDLIEQAWRMETSVRQVKLFESGSYQPMPASEAPAPPKAPSKVSSRADHQARARRICLALPEVEEKEAWGAPTFRVKGKMFAMYLNNHHGDGRVALWLKAAQGVQAMLVEAAPEKFFIPPYQGPFGWIGIHLDRCDDGEIASHVRQAYRLLAPKKLLDLLDQDQA